ncbi:hypothetical protein [Sporosarcina sp. Marseille-Q4943]|uniref:hypothetical protein n=1 Tax=Sporosarcina sp. Marseille-Q4943 TaxID=2942204 RepID=UPI00208DB795|nr:hypothetical protein [Sporosarcina sp. Marseille-Q4943]
MSLAEVLARVPFDDEVALEIERMASTSPELLRSLKKCLLNMHDFIELVEKRTGFK